jgi:hypothetical protein
MNHKLFNHIDTTPDFNELFPYDKVSPEEMESMLKDVRREYKCQLLSVRLVDVGLFVTFFGLFIAWVITGTVYRKSEIMMGLSILITMLFVFGVIFIYSYKNTLVHKMQAYLDREFNLRLKDRGVYWELVNPNKGDWLHIHFGGSLYNPPMVKDFRDNL